MPEITQTESLDKYRVEINRGTTGGQIGFSVRCTGSDREQVRQEALQMAQDLDVDLNVAFPKPEPKAK